MSNWTLFVKILIVCKAILLHRRSFFTIFPSLVNSHLIQKCILSSNITDNQVCQLSQFCFDSFFLSKRNDFTNFNVAKYYISSVVVSMYLSKAKESTGKRVKCRLHIEICEIVAFWREKSVKTKLCKLTYLVICDISRKYTFLNQMKIKQIGKNSEKRTIF